METLALKALIEKHIPGCKASVSGDGYHFDVTVVSDEFTQLNKVKRQQRVYQALNEQIQSGELHAVSIKTLTKSEANNG